MELARSSSYCSNSTQLNRWKSELLKSTCSNISIEDTPLVLSSLNLFVCWAWFRGNKESNNKNQEQVKWIVELRPRNRRLNLEYLRAVLSNYFELPRKDLIQ
ncbi:hypothetical protein L1987_47944 [Smallanthus sonchifolius]|uniref:Uncharacterized protein n=1 Tax=Smallanthus sonchifolius TaxID=185202 RepID=A0ACB9FQF2_9ASTR|nr:hypothetical protein L1987_47944 [Smallanthus sonchifolius]